MSTEASEKNLLFITDIARWQQPHLAAPPLMRQGGGPPEPDPPTWVAEIPSLQRGAVWKPGQVELLWDSLFRGFPIGALVLTEKLQNQASRMGKHAENEAWKDASVGRRHLLDGQQRSNAIALGFVDPFKEEAAVNAEPRTRPAHILWADLCPTPSLFKEGSTRQYLFRVTNRAHPWGYDTDDSAPTLHAAAMNEGRKGRDIISRRPHPTELWPFRANAPIPVAWLFQAAADPQQDMKNLLLQRCKSLSLPWAAAAVGALEDPAQAEAWHRIASGVQRALQVRVPLLMVSEEAIGLGTRGERAGTTRQNIANIEHLFQRLNNAGSPISKEDLQYSMIKAYWPGIEAAIAQVQPVPMRSSRLALLGIRAALVTQSGNSAKLPGDLNVRAMRQLAVAQGPDDVRERGLARHFFGLDNLHGKATEAPLVRVIRQVDQWLLHRQEEAEGSDYGLPPTLRTTIAHRSPEVYLLLMVVATRILREGSDPAPFRQPIVALGTALHWFSRDQHKAVSSVFALLWQSQGRAPLTPADFTGILARVEPSCIAAIPQPETGPDWAYLPEPTLDDVNTANWIWKAVVEMPSAGDEAKWNELRETLWSFTGAIIENKELLLYAQRELMALKFGDFDRGDEEAWEDHNRPWDYDHLTPYSVSQVKGNVDRVAFFRKWLNTAGNFHVLPFAENRSRGAVEARYFFKGHDEKQLLRMLLKEPGDLDLYSVSKQDLKARPEAVLRFAKAARSRLLRMYQDWHGATQAACLLTPPPQALTSVVHDA